MPETVAVATKRIDLTPSDLTVIRTFQAQQAHFVTQAQQLEARAAELRERGRKALAEALRIVCSSHPGSGTPAPDVVKVTLERDEVGGPRLEWDEAPAKAQDLAGAAALKAAVGELGKDPQ